MDLIPSWLAVELAHMKVHVLLETPPLVNHTLTQVACFINGGMLVVLCTGISDLDEVQTVLKDLIDWKRLGLKLGLIYPTLEKIGTEQHGVIERCKTEMLAAWFKLQDKVTQKGVPSWSTLQRALRDIGENEIASQITVS